MAIRRVCEAMKVQRGEKEFNSFLALNFDSMYNNLNIEWCIKQISHLITNVLGILLDGRMELESKVPGKKTKYNTNLWKDFTELGGVR